MRLEVHKLGGTSVGSAERIAAAARLLIGAAGSTRLVAVASAMTGVTDDLVRAARIAAGGDGAGARAIAAAVVARHEEVLDRMGCGLPRGVAEDIRHIGGELHDLLGSVALLGELTARSRDRILACGEKMSVRLLALQVRHGGRGSVALDADGFLDTDDRFGEASPLPAVADRTIRAALQPWLDRGEIPIVTGFCGRAPDGATTTLGRGGSDFSATIIAAALGADEVTIWTDVEGVFTASPRVVPEARVIPQLHYREAAELSFYGAKVLHQRTMIPVARRGIAVRTKSSFAPDAPGTVVDGRFTPGSHPVKAISAVGDHSLLSIEGKGMAGVPGVAARVFSALARRGISVTMISQSSSEASICLAVPAPDATAGEAALKRELAAEMGRGDVEEIVIRHGTSLVACVGLGMAHTPGVAARVFAALARKGLNVLAIAQGSSELNITLAVDATEADDAVRALHQEFGLHRLDTGEDTTHLLDLMILGCGKIGRALAALVLERHAGMFARFGLRPRVVAVGDRSGHLLRPAGIPSGELAALLQHKASGGRVAELAGAVATTDPGAMVRSALDFRLARPILVDVSDADGAHVAFLQAFAGGCDVVTANKLPLAGPLAAYRDLMVAAASSRRLLKAEATVGAGLPVVDTLEMLLLTGDRLSSVEGCFSGTLGFLMTRLEQGQPFSDAVAEAVRLGYTEPDPVVDLSGADVGRKAVILGRLSGLVAADVPVALEGLVPQTLAGLPLPDLLGHLRDLDRPMAERVAAARAAGQALRYVARVAEDRVTVGPELVAADSPLGMLKGTDNIVVFRSERYRDRPLVVTGPGAGVEVTAMGVLSDILRVAAERR